MSDVKTLREKRGVGILPAFILAYSILIRFRIFLLTQEEEVNLGTKDSKAKEYLSDNTRFSEICNYVLFDGEKVIKPENLKECDTTEVLSVFGIDRKQIVKQKWRDLLKGVSVKYTESVYIVLMGIEAQTDVHYSMPVKTMIYDAMNYGEQVNEAKKQHQKNKDYKSSDEFLSGFTLEDRLTPVITITLYLGTKNWDGPRSLVEMMPHMDERFRPFINDYRINLLNPLEITDFSKFKTGLKPLFEVLKNASDEGKLNDLITKARCAAFPPRSLCRSSASRARSSMQSASAVLPTRSIWPAARTVSSSTRRRTPERRCPAGSFPWRTVI